MRTTYCSLPLSVLAVVLAEVAVASADYVVVTSDTTGQPTWNRPIQGEPPTGISGAGTAVPFQTVNFTVDADGGYDLFVRGTNPADWDTYLFLYQNSFNPVDQLTNVIIGNDDLVTIEGMSASLGMSGFRAVSLTVGTNYTAVVTGFANTDAGQYRLSIGGPGQVLGSGGTVQTVSSIDGELAATDPTFFRPVQSNFDPPVTTAGTAVPVDLYSLSVAADGVYDIYVSGLNGGDTYLILYEGSFNPNDPLADAVIANDDLEFSIFGSGLHSLNLTAGTNYFVAVAGFGPTSFDLYTLEVFGTSTATLNAVPVPEPKSVLLIVLGLLAVGLTARHWRRAAV